jgi:hypothetical protein
VFISSSPVSASRLDVLELTLSPDVADAAAPLPFAPLAHAIASAPAHASAIRAMRRSILCEVVIG